MKKPVSGKQKIKEWSGNVAQVRTRKRSEYAAGPAIEKWFMAAYRKEVVQAKRKNRDAKVLVLGATPETRDLVLGNSLNLTSIDQSEEMVQKMTSLMRNHNSKEKVAAGNWMKMPFKNNRFDLVLGDGVSNNIAYADQVDFFKEIRRVLKKDGVMLVREAVLENVAPRFSVKEILKEYRQTQNFPILFLKCNLFSEVSSRAKRKNFFDMGKMFENLEVHKNSFKTAEFEKLMTWRGDIKHSIFEEDDLKLFVNKAFGNLQLIENRRSDKFIFKIFKFFKAVK